MSGFRDDLRKLNQWLGSREDGRLKVNRPSTNERRTANRKKRMGLERVLRWQRKHRLKYNAKMRKYRRMQAKKRRALVTR